MSGSEPTVPALPAGLEQFYVLRSPAWKPPPSAVTVPLPEEIRIGSERWTEIVVRPPKMGEFMKAAAVPGASQADITIKLIALVTGMSEDAAKELPAYLIQKINEYFEAFAAGPPIFPTEGG